MGFICEQLCEALLVKTFAGLAFSHGRSLNIRQPIASLEPYVPSRCNIFKFLECAEPGGCFENEAPDFGIFFNRAYHAFRQQSRTRAYYRLARSAFHGGVGPFALIFYQMLLHMRSEGLALSLPLSIYPNPERPVRGQRDKFREIRITY